MFVLKHKSNCEENSSQIIKQKRKKQRYNYVKLCFKGKVKVKALDEKLEIMT